MKNPKDFAQDLIHFIDASPTPFHAVREIKKRLNAAGFEQLKETDFWGISGQGKYYVVRGGASVAAFIIGGKKLAQTGFKIIGAHTDSPSLKLKPNYAYNRSGYLQFGVESYGGGIWRTWLDRDLYIAGRIVVRTADGQLSSHLVELKDLVISIPSLAIHLQRDVNENGAINTQTDLPPVVSLENSQNIDTFKQRLLDACGIDDAEIISTALFLCSAESGNFAGLHREFIRSGQLDDLASCHEAITSLVETKEPPATCVVSLWNHEEVGSASFEGAGGSFLKTILKRIAEGRGSGTEGGFKRILVNSFCISADMAHAAHPNHLEKHEPRHFPFIGGGPVIKWNANQRYATDDHTGAVFAHLCAIAGIPYQTFVSRSDLSCGSTIGPITAAKLGIPVVDVGNAMLAMHSIREQCGTEDHIAMEKVFETFFARENEIVIEA